MNQPRTFLALVAFFVYCFSSTSALAQTPPPARASEPSFDIVLQTVVASNDAGGRSDLAPSLSGIVRKLKTDFPFSNYRLSSASIQRVSNRSGVSSKNITFTPEKNFAVYSTLNFDSLEVLTDENGQEMFQVRRFNFSQQLPITNSIGAINYETINLSGNFSLVRNVPTVIGSLSTLKPDELMFLILTIKAAEK